MKALFLLVLVVSLALVLNTNSNYSYAYKTGSYNFCSAFPAFPECVGWRTDAISDSFNYWFCDYVNLPKLCENKPDPEKQIMLRNEDFCCRFIGPDIETSLTKIQDTSTSNQLLGKNSPDASIKPLIIWTDKDHYNFGDKVTIYGKFDFTSLKIKKSISEKEFDQTGRVVNGTSIQTGRIITETPVLDIDIKLNGRNILRNIPVYENGWFATFFYLNDRYHFANQNNLLEVDYLQYDNVPLGGPRTHAIYHFTTGDISKKDGSFGIWLDDSLLPNKIRYGVTTENPEKFIELASYNMVISRLTTPQGYVIPIESDFTIQNISTEYSGFVEFGHGTYEIQVTYGNNTSKTTFDY